MMKKEKTMIKTTMTMINLLRVERAKKVVTLMKMRTRNPKAARRAATKRVALQQLAATSRSANSNEIKQFKMMLKIYHNDN